jgi:DNA-binding CsgD family transcriptional regulator
MTHLLSSANSENHSPRLLGATETTAAVHDESRRSSDERDLRSERVKSGPSRCSVRCVIESDAAHELSKFRTRAHLTRAEVEVLGCALLRMTYQEIATARGVSLNTVKSQMKALLAKLCIDRSADLAEALSRLPGEPVHCEFTLRLEVRATEEGVQRAS